MVIGPNVGKLSHDVLRCCLFGADFDLAGAAKCADNSVMSGLGAQRKRRSQGAAQRMSARTSEQAYTKKVRIVCWKAAMGHWASGKAAWRWARTCAAGWYAGFAGGRGSNWGGGQRSHRAVRILLCAWSNRFQMRCMVRSLSWQWRARLAAWMPRATAHWRNRHSAPAVRLSRRILSAHQTLKVRPQPGRAWRLLQKIRRARTTSCRGLLSSKPYKNPCQFRRRQPCSADRVLV
jgi:hypothetical protein